MRVLYVDQTGQLGGGELSLYDIVTQLSYEAEVVLFEDGPFRGRLEAAGVPVSVLNGGLDVGKESGLLKALLAMPVLARLVTALAGRARSADVVYANTQKALAVGALAAWVARKPLIWHLRDMLNAEHFSPTMRRLAVGLANRKAAVVIANSQATGEAFVAAGGRADLLRVVYNGIDAAPFVADAQSQIRDLRRELGGEGKTLVGVFGRLAPWKGQHVLLEALAQCPDCVGVIVGDALFGETVYARELRALAEREALQGRVRFLGFRSDVSVLMRAMDIVVHTSTSPEPFGRVIVEGMLAGRPVIASAAGGALEIIEDGRSGLLYPPGDAQALAAALNRMVGDPEAAQALGRTGQTIAKERFSLEALIQGVDEVVTAVLGRTGKAVSVGL